MFRYLCTEDEAILSQIKPISASYAFSGLIPVIAGKVVAVPSELALSQPTFYYCNLTAGDVVPPPTHFYNHMGYLVTRGETPAECMERFNAALFEFQSHLRIMSNAHN